MYLSHLSLTNFRNYARLELPLSPGVTILTGDNAQGKSNLLEAILFLATARSFRAGGDRELIAWFASEESLRFARIGARVQRATGPVRIEVVIKEGQRLEEDEHIRQESERGKTVTTVSKRIRVNDLPKRALDLIGVANAVMFSPEDLDLVSGPPSLRRRYLDVTVSQIDPRYVRTLAQYNKVLAQRNHLLRQLRDIEGPTDQLEFWDRELASAGVYLMQQRAATVDALNSVVRDLHATLAADDEQLQIVYQRSVGEAVKVEIGAGGGEDKRQEAALAFLDLLRRERRREIAYGASLYGPHRDDLVFHVNDRNAGAYASRGQQRTVAVSLKLAEASFMRDRTGDQPVILLDDVLSELDAGRAERILDLLGNLQQVLITAIDQHSFSPGLLDQATVRRVVAGTIRQSLI